MSQQEINNITLGNWTFDVFLCEAGNLGFTVYEKEKPRKDDTTRCVDIFVDSKLKVKSL